MTRILHVEDDANVASSIKRLFRRIGMDVDNATSVGAAIAMIESCPNYDVIVSDFNLDGGTTGGQLIVWVREYRAELAGRFMFLTTVDVSEFGVPHLDKPCEPSELRRAVASLIRMD